MRILIDMSLSPAWRDLLEQHGITALHWSSVGDVRAADSSLMSWASANGYIVFTNDLDFSAILAATGGAGPSVIQARARDITPDGLQEVVIGALQQFKSELMDGAIVTIDESRARVRILPL